MIDNSFTAMDIKLEKKDNNFANHNLNLIIHQNNDFEMKREELYIKCEYPSITEGDEEVEINVQVKTEPEDQTTEINILHNDVDLKYRPLTNEATETLVNVEDIKSEHCRGSLPTFEFVNINQTDEHTELLATTESLNQDEQNIEKLKIECDPIKKSLKCEVCNQSFTRADNLRTHILTHNGVKPHSCDVCNKSFTRHSNLRRHKAIHTSQNSFICDVCNQGFVQNSNLERHKRIHTGEKTYECEICSQGFIRSYSLKLHKLTHNLEKPYACDICNQGFIQKYHLKVHKRNQTCKKS